MGKKMKIKNQKEYARNMYENGHDFLDGNKIYFPLKLLSLYLRDCIGMKPKQREEFVYNFVEKNLKDYNKVLQYKTIDRALNQAKNKKLYLKIFEQIEIYQEEIDYLKKLDIEEKQKNILFCLLCSYKIDLKKSNENKQTYFISERTLPILSIKKKSNITFSEEYGIQKALKNLSDKEYISITKKSRINALFIQHIPTPSPDSEPILEIDNFDTFGLYYEYLSGNPKVKYCEECGELFKMPNGKGSFRKYCNKCKKEMDNGEKEKICEQCGSKFVVSSKDNKSLLCDGCYENYRREYQKKLMRKISESKKNEI